MRALMLLLFVLSLVPVEGHAIPSTELCYSPAQNSQNATPPDASTVFTCPLGGNATLAQLGGLGYQIVKLTPIASGGQTRQQLMVQRDPVLFQDGFE